MEQLLNDLINFLMPQSSIFLYLFLFLSAIVENLFPPIPGDTITAFGAFLVGTGRLNYWLVYLSTTVGSVFGFMALFYLGRFLEKEFFMKKNYSFFSADSIMAAEKWFSKYGLLVVLFNRFLPGVRSVISIVSGISKLNPLKVFLLSLVSAGIWNLIWIQIGFMLGNNWDVVKHKMSQLIYQYNLYLGITLAILIVLFLLYKYIKKKRS